MHASIISILQKHYPITDNPTYHEGKRPVQLCHTRMYRSWPSDTLVATRNHISAPDSWTYLVLSANAIVSLIPREPIMYMATVAEVPALCCHPVITVTR